MQRLKNLAIWLGDCGIGLGVLAVCFALAFWETVIVGRRLDEREDVE